MVKSEIVSMEPNHTKWKLGDVVIHDADAKRPEMLMIVIGVRNDSEYVYTLYVHGNVEKQVYYNHREMLHDPAKFGIEVTIPPVGDEASYIVPGKDPYETVREYVFLRYRMPRVEYPLPLKMNGIGTESEMGGHPEVTVAVYESTGENRNMGYPVGASWIEYEYQFKGLRVI